MNEKDNLLVKIKTSEFRDKQNNKTVEFESKYQQTNIPRQYPPNIDAAQVERTS